MEKVGTMKSITELEQEGWNKDLLYRICHMPNTPFFRCSPRGKFYVLEEKLREFVSQRRVGR